MQHTSIPLTLAFGPQGCMAEVKGRVVAVWCRDEVPMLFCGGLTFLSLSLIIPDRAVETVEAWLKQHPSVEVVSRDGSSEYAAAIRQGAPQARQVSDRWHLVKNLTVCVSVQLAKTLTKLRHAEERRTAPTQAIQLERELRAKGYKGSPHGIYRYLETLKAAKLAPSKQKSAAKLASSIQPNALLTLSASQATWLFFRKEEDLKPEEQETLRQLRQASPQLEVAYQLVDEFLHMVRERTGEQLDSWLNKVETSHLPAFQTFVTGVHKDKDAVLAGLTLPWSTGPVEGHVNRLKLIKRSMYGRAEFDLLKLR